MASFRDELRTTLAIDGLSQYLAGLRQAQQGNVDAVIRLKELQDNLTGIGRLLFRVGESLGVQAGQWTILAAAMYGARSIFNQIRQVVQEAMGDFEKYNSVLVRTAFLFSSMGESPGLRGIQSFARERAAVTGISEEDTLTLLGRARQTGFGARTAGRLIPLLQDLQTSGGPAAGASLDILNQLLHQEGRGRGSLGAINQVATQLRLDPRFFTGGQQHDLEEVMRQLTQRVGGLSEVMGQTISGTFARHQELLHQSMERLGAIIEAGLMPYIEILNTSLLGANRAFDILTGGRGIEDPTVARGTGSALSQLAQTQPLLAGLLTGMILLQNQGQIEASKQQQQANKYLQQIAANTLNLPSALALAIFGSASAFTRQAGSFRNFQAAINSRF